MSKTSTTPTRKNNTRKPAVKAAAKPAVKAAAKPVTRRAGKAAPAIESAKAAEPKLRARASRTRAAADITTPPEVKKAIASVEQTASAIDAGAHQIIESGEKLMNDQVKQFTDLQARTLEPMRMFSAMAVDAMEQLVRKNYEVMGDIVDFSVKQVQLPAQTENMTEVAQSRMAETTAFTELLGNRANEYIELGNQFSQKAREVTDEVVAATKAA